jgi:SPOR domain
LIFLKNYRILVGYIFRYKIVEIVSYESMKKTSILFLIASFLIIYGCSASTADRYSTSESKTISPKEQKTYKEDFDLTKYRAKIDAKDITVDSASTGDNNVWYNFKADSSKDTTAPQIIGQSNGYRIQIYVTDNLQEADSVKDDLTTKLSQNDVYISFDPPFYKVKIGDFKNYSDAKDYRFKLNQLGYSDARIVNDKINLYNK